MTPEQTGLERPIRVVLFSGGPSLESGVQQFIYRLVAQPQIEFVAAFCQAEAQGWPAITLDLWRRRRLLALPLLFIQFGSSLSRVVRRSGHDREINRTLTQLAERIHFVPDIHAGPVLAQVRALAPDLGLIYGSPILKPELFEIPARGTLGIHHGKVPEYRGKKTTFWAMYNGEKSAGVTIQKVNAGLDTGQIVKAGEVPTTGRSLAAVWTELEQLGLDLYIQAIIEVKSGVAQYRLQVGKKGKLYRDPKPGDILTFWARQLKRRFGP